MFRPQGPAPAYHANRCLGKDAVVQHGVVRRPSGLHGPADLHELAKRPFQGRLSRGGGHIFGEAVTRTARPGCRL